MSNCWVNLLALDPLFLQGMYTLGKANQINDDGRTLRFNYPASYFAKEPGCYYAVGRLVDEISDRILFEWRWWYQVRAENEKMERLFAVSCDAFSSFLATFYFTFKRGPSVLD